MTPTIEPNSMISVDVLTTADAIERATLAQHRSGTEFVIDAANLVEVRRQTDQVVGALNLIQARLERIDGNGARIAEALERLAPPVEPITPSNQDTLMIHRSDG
jgi:hypothetical protein